MNRFVSIVPKGEDPSAYDRPYYPPKMLLYYGRKRAREKVEQLESNKKLQARFTQASRYEMSEMMQDMERKPLEQLRKEWDEMDGNTKFDDCFRFDDGSTVRALEV